MSGDVTQLLMRIERGDLQSADQLLPLVYAELRKLAVARLAKTSEPISLMPTDLVHEAYLRLLPGSDSPAANQWEGRRHFLGAATEAMRRIVVDGIRRRQALKRGGDFDREELPESRLMAPIGRGDDEVLAIHESLDQLAATAPQAAEVVKLRYFTGLSVEETAEALDISPRTVKRQWAYARALLLDMLDESEPVRVGE